MFTLVTSCTPSTTVANTMQATLVKTGTQSAQDCAAVSLATPRGRKVLMNPLSKWLAPVALLAMLLIETGTAWGQVVPVPPITPTPPSGRGGVGNNQGDGLDSVLVGTTNGYWRINLRRPTLYPKWESPPPPPPPEPPSCGPSRAMMLMGNTPAAPVAVAGGVAQAGGAGAALPAAPGYWTAGWLDPSAGAALPAAPVAVAGGAAGAMPAIPRINLRAAALMGGPTAEARRGGGGAGAPAANGAPAGNAAPVVPVGGAVPAVPVPVGNVGN